MSIKLMSSIFDTEFRDLTDIDGNVTKASTAKLVLLALADHANDEGEGAYPGLTKMELKTGLSRQGIINTYDALKYNGIIFLIGESKYGTNNYTINVTAFPPHNGSQPALLVNPLDHPSKATLPEVVKPLDLNHPLTIHKSGVPPEYPPDWHLANGGTPPARDETQAQRVDFANLLATGVGPEAYEIALAFQMARDITLPESKVKGQRKAVREMMEMGVKAVHVADATRQLMEKNLTVTDLYSVSKTAIDLANKPKAEQEPTRLL